MKLINRSTVLLLVVCSTVFARRYYDAETGVWISPDPKEQFFSPYSYTGNGCNPVTSIDPDGMETHVIVGSDSKVVGFNHIANDNQLVFFQNEKNIWLNIAVEPPANAYFFKNNLIGYTYVGDKMGQGMTRLLTSANLDIRPISEYKWYTNFPYDFKNNIGQKTVGAGYGLALTSRDGGNYIWGWYMAQNYGALGFKGMTNISNIIAGGREDPESYSLQVKGWNDYQKISK